MTRCRIAVLASGGGSNLQAILDHLRALGDARPADVVLVGSDRPDAGALDRARQAGVTTSLVTPADAASLARSLEEHGVQLVALAGYLKLVPAPVTQRFAGRMVNVHPALLPDFGGPGLYGARVHRAVLASGAETSGATVHFVDEVYDHGTVIAQFPVPVRGGDDERTLAARVLRAEHLLYPRVVAALAAGRAPARGLALPPLDPDLDDDTNARRLERALAR